MTQPKTSSCTLDSGPIRNHSSTTLFKTHMSL